MPRNKKYVYICSPKRKVFPCGIYWRDAGVVDRAALEMRCTGNCTGGSNPSLSAELTGQKWSVNGQKATNQRFVAFFIARKSSFQDFKSTVKDKVSLLNRYLFPAGQKR